VLADAGAAALLALVLLSAMLADVAAATLLAIALLSVVLTTLVHHVPKLKL
jgi:hypothetical protein